MTPGKRSVMGNEIYISFIENTVFTISSGKVKIYK